MELTPSGFYKTTRVIKGLDFLPFVRDILKRGNEIYVKFMGNQDPEIVLDFTRLYDTGYDNSVLFQISDRPRGGYSPPRHQPVRIHSVPTKHSMGGDSHGKH